MVFDIRRATPTDAAAVCGMRRAWTEENVGEPVPDDTFEARFDAWLEREQDQRVTWLGSVDGVAVGMLNVLVFSRMPAPMNDTYHRPTQWGYLANLYVHPEHRGTGMGGALVDACTAYADERGFARVVLSPSTRSVPLYARHGFEPATSLMIRHQADPHPRDGITTRRHCPGS